MAIYKGFDCVFLCEEIKNNFLSLFIRICLLFLPYFKIESHSGKFPCYSSPF